ncbi:winged helix-turn-helix domain-containing protein [Peristeroidobacter soli]|uniref:winged helix-turn-helix domain-containing protein n=1 Tax=Peristeroidobacter soli TaxID=2497877 RepID=UPI00101D9513|nr:winged helix-turn-helix domain-containing protein [Peristeroidobacter soli]
MKAKLGPLQVDEMFRRISVEGQPLAVSRRGVELIVLLGRSPDTPVRREFLLQKLWPDRDVGDKTLSMLVVAVRRQLAPYFDGIEPIKAEPRIGYQLMVPYRPSESTFELAQIVLRAPTRMQIAVLDPAILSAGSEAARLGACLRESLLTHLGAEVSLDVSVVGATLDELERQRAEVMIESAVRVLDAEVHLSVRCLTLPDRKICWASGERAALDDAFTAEAALCGRLIEELRLATSSHTGRQLWRHYRRSSSYRVLAEGQQLVAARSAEGLAAARKKFSSVLEADPGCAAALVGMADCEILAAWYDGAARNVATQRAMTYIERALVLDAELASAHSTCGFVHLACMRFAPAERELLRAMQLDDSNAAALQWYADFLVSQGRVQAAVHVAHLAVARAPESVVVNTQLGQLLHMAGRFEDSQEQLQRTLALDSHTAGALGFSALNAMMLGQADAVQLGRRAVELSPSTPIFRGIYASALARFGERERALHQFHAIEANAQRSTSFAEAAMLVAAALGQTKRAISWFRAATADAAAWTLYAPTLPMLEAVRQEPSFTAMLHGRGMAVAAA